MIGRGRVAGGRGLAAVLIAVAVLPAAARRATACAGRWVYSQDGRRAAALLRDDNLPLSIQRIANKETTVEALRAERRPVRLSEDWGKGGSAAESPGEPVDD